MITKDFFIPRFRVDGSTYGRFLARRWGMRSLPAVSLLLLATVFSAVIFDVRVAIAIVMLCGVALPMVWLLAMDRLFARSKRLSSPCSVRFTAAGQLLKIEYYAFDTDDETAAGNTQPQPTHSVTLRPGEYSVAYSGPHMVIDFADGPLLAPLDSIILSPQDGNFRCDTQR